MLVIVRVGTCVLVLDGDMLDPNNTAKTTNIQQKTDNRSSKQVTQDTEAAKFVRRILEILTRDQIKKRTNQITVKIDKHRQTM